VDEGLESAGVEMNYPQTVEEMIRWPCVKSRDKLGTIYIITGFEGTGRCFWCGSELTGKQKRYCRTEVTDDDFVEDLLSDKVAHWRLYWRYFCWTYAAPWCLERYDYRCANCGYHHVVPAGDHPSWYTRGLEVHHIVPLEGGERLWSPYNVPFNLISLCHSCHLEIHAIMRLEKKIEYSVRHDIFKLAEQKGQMILPNMPPLTRDMVVV
jgi:hypothetical protein